MTELTEAQRQASVPPQTPEEWAGYARFIYAEHSQEDLEALLPWLEERVARLTANSSIRLRDRAAAGLAEVKRRLATFKAEDEEGSQEAEGVADAPT